MLLVNWTDWFMWNVSGNVYTYIGRFYFELLFKNIHILICLVHSWLLYIQADIVELIIMYLSFHLLSPCWLWHMLDKTVIIYSQLCIIIQISWMQASLSYMYSYCYLTLMYSWGCFHPLWAYFVSWFGHNFFCVSASRMIFCVKSYSDTFWETEL